MKHHSPATSQLDKIAAVPKMLQKWLTGSNSVSILVTGRTGTGKSSLINGVVGSDMVKERDNLDRETLIKHSFYSKYNRVEITVWDSPGLQDGLDKAEEYIRVMQQEGCANSDLVLYCAKMNDSRLRREDRDAIRKLTIGLGKQIWNNAVFVMIFANEVRARRERGQKLTPDEEHKWNSTFFKRQMEEWKAKLAATVVEAGVDDKTAASIPIVPAGYDKEQALPDRDNWLSPLWYVSILRMNEYSQPAFLKANLHQIKFPNQLSSEDVDRPIHQQLIIYKPIHTKYGALPIVYRVIGALIGDVTMPAGAVVHEGGATGTAVGNAIAFFASGGSETGIMEYESDKLTNVQGCE